MHSRGESTVCVDPVIDDGAVAGSSAPTADLTIIIPAYNEVEHVAETVASVLRQTLRPACVVVVDDCSIDGTASAGRRAGAQVLTPPRNTGSKAGAQNYALAGVTTRYTLAVDADTVLAPDGVERLMTAMADPEVAAACGFVVPRYVQTVWERGRYVEYLYSFSFLKPVQDYYRKPLISSGCFSMYRTADLLAAGGWSTRTMAEDMDLTWTFYQRGKHVRFVPGAVCYPVEPHDLSFLGKQLRRWSSGFIQNVRLHKRGLLHIPYLRAAISVACWDAFFSSLFLFIALPLLIVFVSPLLAVGYVFDAPVLLLPIAVGAWRRRELRRALASYPAFYLLRLVNAGYFLHAVWRELILRRPLLVYEKGH